MRRIAIRLALVALMTVVVAITVSLGTAWAKDADRVVITGPGLSHPIAVRPDDEASSATLDLLRQGTGISAALNQGVDGDFAARPPTGDLGPRYRLQWNLPASSQDGNIGQDLYPYAPGTSVTYTPKQAHVARTGWYMSPAFLKNVLISLGLPERSPVSGQPAASSTATERSGNVNLVVVTVAIILLTPVAVTAALVVRRRHRSKTVSGKEVGIGGSRATSEVDPAGHPHGKAADRGRRSQRRTSEHI